MNGRLPRLLADCHTAAGDWTAALPLYRMLLGASEDAVIAAAASEGEAAAEVKDDVAVALAAEVGTLQRCVAEGLVSGPAPDAGQVVEARGLLAAAAESATAASVPGASDPADVGPDT